MSIIYELTHFPLAAKMTGTGGVWLSAMPGQMIDIWQRRAPDEQLLRVAMLFGTFCLESSALYHVPQDGDFCQQQPGVNALLRHPIE